MKRTREFQKLEKVRAQKNLAAAQGEKQRARLCQLLNHVFDLQRFHLPMIFVIEIAGDAPLVAAVGEIHMDAPGKVALPRPANQAVHHGSARHASPSPPATRTSVAFPPALPAVLPGQLWPFPGRLHTLPRFFPLVRPAFCLPRASTPGSPSRSARALGCLPAR